MDIEYITYICAGSEKYCDGTEELSYVREVVIENIHTELRHSHSLRYLQFFPKERLEVLASCAHTDTIQHVSLSLLFFLRNALRSSASNRIRYPICIDIA